MKESSEIKEKTKFEYYWHAFFEIGVGLKFFNGIWEVISGFLILHSSREQVNHVFRLLTLKELREDPHDRLVNFLGIAIYNSSIDTKLFIALYILIHGSLNIFLAIQLYRNKLWSYVAAMTIMSLMIVYQVSRVFSHHSKILMALTVIDIIFVILTWHEYKKQLRKASLIKN